MPSTVIRHFHYRPGCQELEVTFVTGRRYVYLDVPTHVAADFRAAFSKGVFFNRHVRDCFTCRELSAETTPELSTRSV